MIYMKTNILKVAFIITIFIAAMLCASCATYKATLLDTEYEGPVPDGMYTVIKYGANHYDDFATFALLIPEQGAYKFDIYRPDFDYNIVKGVSANAARQMAREFVKNHPEFLRSSSRAIIMPDGNVAGYEVRALYRRTFLGPEDLFEVTYLLRVDNVIEVRIKLDEAVLMYFMGGESN
jgi:hypothetical protein